MASQIPSCLGPCCQPLSFDANVAFQFYLMDTDRLHVWAEAEKMRKLFKELFGKDEPGMNANDDPLPVDCALFREFLDYLIANDLGRIEAAPDAKTIAEGEVVKIYPSNRVNLNNTQFVVLPPAPGSRAVNNANPRINTIQLSIRQRNP